MLFDAQPGTGRRGPKPSALAGSVGLHSALVAWMFFGPSPGSRTPAEPAKNPYQQLIAGNEKKLVWYNFRDKLPQVSPLERHGISRPPRSDMKTSKQTIVANPPRAKKAKQMVYLPAPPKQLDKDMEAPNLFAFAVPKIPPPDKPPVKLFAPPAEVIRKLVPPEPLPDAPQVTSAVAKLELPQPDALPKPKPKEFVPPQEAKRDESRPRPIPDAPKVASTQARVDLPKPGRLPAREFVPPREEKREPAAATVPDAPKIAAAGRTPELERRGFVAPPERSRTTRSNTSMPDAPQVAPAQAKVNLPQPERLRAREFVAPRSTRRATSAATVPEAPKVTSTTAKLTLPAAPKLPPRKFVPPSETRRAAAAASSTVPEPPRVGPTSAHVNLPQPDRLRARRFVPPKENSNTSSVASALPNAPRVGGEEAKLDLPRPGRLPAREFVPPKDKPNASGASASLPNAPQVGGTSAGIHLPQPGRLPAREFVPPKESASGSSGAPSIPDAPRVANSEGSTLPGAFGPGPRLKPREFTPPADGKPSPATAPVLPVAPQIEEAPAMESAPAGSLTAAIVGLQPAPELKALPESARPADVSSAPQRRTEGGTGEPVESARLFVPNLMIRDGAIPEPDATLVKGVVKAGAAPTSIENLMEAAKAAPVLRSEVRLPGVSQVPDAPDPRFSGRIVYMASIQMPNVTSYIGSWIMWFADREPMPGVVREMRPPVPVRKVDPKYVASAMAERVQGKVRLSAVIRRDGHVDEVKVLKHLDDRLDFSAVEALEKWEFEPARRDGRPVDVDVIFEIPFELEPLASR
jgi:TonB family protein